jgi:hypothetical protein
MGALKRTRSGVDAIEHALRGVHTSENSHRIVSYQRDPGFIGSHSVVQVDVLDDTPVEREVIVHVATAADPGRRRSRRSRRSRR